MASLFTSLVTTANALNVYNRELQVTENNVVNASTPGYAKQTEVLTALPFDLSVGLPGGVGAGAVVSARDAFAEQAVQQAQSELGTDTQIQTSLSAIQNTFIVSGDSGINGALSGLFNSFSQLSINPGDTVSRQNVLDKAAGLAAVFRHTASQLAAGADTVDSNIRGSVDQINTLTRQIAQINADRHGTTASDAGGDAALHSALEQLAGLVDFKALQQPDGSVTVYLGGQVPLVAGDHSFAIGANFSSSAPQIVDAQGHDITGMIQKGSLGGALTVRNQLLPGYAADLNTLAQSVADQVNTTLAAGVDASGLPPAKPLFSYNAAAGAAATITVNPLTPDQLAAATPAAPGGNGNALALAGLADGRNTNGYTFAEFYGNLAARSGADLSNAQSSASARTDILNQAQQLRKHLSGVSLDEEAAHMIEFQRAYEAAAKMVTVLDNLTNTVVNMLGQQ